ncbi:hypothetical protein ACHAWF_007847 [Thalassiosira exigua]
MECFGDSSDDDDDDDIVAANLRDESCGVLSFHPNTETSLLAHVRNVVKSPASSTSENGDRKSKLQRSKDVLLAIDEFCTSRHWMMHVGPEKGGILLGALQEAIDDKAKRCQSESNKSFVAVELGTYCGYASILMGRMLCEANTENMKCHLFTTEISREYAEIAIEMVRLSSLEDLITVHQVSYYDGQEDTDVVKVIDEALKEDQCVQNENEQTTIDFLFIDHDKDAYKSDLCKFEASGMIRRGTKVVADNVLFASINDYLSHVQQRKEKGVVDTRTIQCHVEYCGDVDIHSGGQQYRDGVEITDYLEDP